MLGNAPMLRLWVTKVQNMVEWHICVSKLTIIGSDNDLSPGRRRVIIWTNAEISSIRTLGTNFSEILSKIHTFSFEKIHLKMSAKWRQYCLGLIMLTPFSLEDRADFIVLRLSPSNRLSSVLWFLSTGGAIGKMIDHVSARLLPSSRQWSRDRAKYFGNISCVLFPVHSCALNYCGSTHKASYKCQHPISSAL